ncbi:uncharacterized protein NPIL_513831 [Nephila pilipes]|uniref:Transmembrane protein n=1 Tax=Nephila pilipes TaxID=299642 RepID=A0A8X6PIT9_NEPPI|nr:uncharacterized protein NPIL_513831 [Nephila pilipes]
MNLPALVDERAFFGHGEEGYSNLCSCFCGWMKYIRPSNLPERHHFVSCVLCSYIQATVCYRIFLVIQFLAMNAQIFIILVVAASVAVSMAFQKTNATVRPAASDKVTAKSARSEYHHGHHGLEHHFPYYHGGHHLGGFGHHKEFDHYLIPLLVVIGLGVLVMPLLGVFMTTLVGNVPVTTLVSGRRKREIPGQVNIEEKITELFKRFGRAFEAFTEENK